MLDSGDSLTVCGGCALHVSLGCATLYLQERKVQEMTTSRKVRLLALAVQRFGADSGTVRSLLEDSNFGLNPNASDRVLAQCLALTAATR